MPSFTPSVPTDVRRQAEQLGELIRDTAVRTGETVRTLAYAYIGALDLAQEQILKVARNGTGR